MRTASWPAAGRLLAREAGFPGLAVVAIVASADVRMPMALPGHRALLWLTMLVATALVTRARCAVLAAGAGATVATAALQLAPGPWASARYLAAAVLLCGVSAVGRRWLIAVAAAPIHLVALAGAAVDADKVVFHLGFGFAAGVLGWAVAAAVDRAARPMDGRSGSAGRGPTAKR
ncbi:hypothetical protein A9W95_15620 [Mycobacterium sp. 1423905.2]|nr:hypothetical protein A9W95_15620 [Mycobacterium sp. 1423905.2]